MRVLPFGSASELEKNVNTLHSFFVYYLVLNPASGEVFSREVVRWIVGHLYGFGSWLDLVRVAASTEHPEYLDDWMEDAHANLSLEFARIACIEDCETIGRIANSFKLAKYGCSAQIRTVGIENQLLFRDYLQADRVLRLQAIYRYHERYACRQTPEFMESLQYEHELALAIEFGRQIPRRPHRHLR